MQPQAPKGTRDILPADSFKWQYIEKIAAEICRGYGYEEIRTPVFEHTELFERGVGDTTDIVQKEMYTFNDKGGRSITLRPEGTAGAVRSYIENGMASLPQPVKLFYFISAYRYENVQKGRLREHHQFGVEAFGAEGPEVDTEIISILVRLFEILGLKNTELSINSVGCPACKPDYSKLFRSYLEERHDKLCKTCKERYEKNPMRILDCKEEGCGALTLEAPLMADHLCGNCSEHFEGLKRGLVNLGINYNVNKRIVRGQDYYTKTVFEFVSKNVGTQGTICGGGRYDGLIEICGGKAAPGIGFGLGFERLLLELDSRGINLPRPPARPLYIAPMGETSRVFAQKLVYELRSEGIGCETDLAGRSLKSQMKYADKLGFIYVIVIGDQELEKRKAVLRNMKTGDEIEVNLDSILFHLELLPEIKTNL